MAKVSPPFLRYLLALLITLLTIALLSFMQGFLTPSTVALLFLIPMLISTTLWGLGPGLVSGFSASLALNYFFTAPYYTFHVLHTQDLIGLTIFLFVVVLTSQLVGRAQKNLEAAKTRELEAMRLYELSVRLVGVNDLSEIAHVFASQVKETFRAERVQVNLHFPETQQISAVFPAGGKLPAPPRILCFQSPPPPASWGSYTAGAKPR